MGEKMYWGKREYLPAQKRRSLIDKKHADVSQTLSDVQHPEIKK